MTEHRIALHRGETVIAVVPEYATGPGWSNAIAWVYIERNDGTLRTECIQPDERSPQLHSLFRSGEAMCAALIGSVPTTKARG